MVRRLPPLLLALALAVWPLAGRADNSRLRAPSGAPNSRAYVRVIPTPPPANVSGNGILRPPQPGTPAAAQIANRTRTFPIAGQPQAFRQAQNGLWVPDRRVLAVDERVMREQAQWMQARAETLGFLHATGARLAPLSYQRLLRRAVERAESVLEQNGLTVEGWKMAVLDGGVAKGVNATTWSGGIIVVNRELVDLSFQIANAVAASKTPRELDQNLFHLAQWRKAGGTAPVFQVHDTRVRDAIAESVVGAATFHEIGHALAGHVAVPPAKIWLPNADKPTSERALEQQGKERQADAMSGLIAGRGGSPLPLANPLLFYFWHLEHPTFDPRGRYTSWDWRSHPIDAERYEALRHELAQLGFNVAALPPLLGRAEPVDSNQAPAAVPKAAAAAREGSLASALRARR